MSPIAKITISFYHCLDMVLNSSSFYHIMLNLRCVIGIIYIHLFSIFFRIYDKKCLEIPKDTFLNYFPWYTQ